MVRVGPGWAAVETEAIAELSRIVALTSGHCDTIRCSATGLYTWQPSNVSPGQNWAIRTSSTPRSEDWRKAGNARSGAPNGSSALPSAHGPDVQ